MGGDPLEYAESEKDLGILINPSFDFNGILILSDLKQIKSLLLRHNCHFVNDFKSRRAC